MRHLIRGEYQRVPRSDLMPAVQVQLEAIARRERGRRGVPVLDTGHRDYVRTLNYVGMIQVPGLTLEIVPKIEDDGVSAIENGSGDQAARHNLLYMLAFTRNLPFEERDIASMSLKRITMPEALRGVFARKLAEELRRGVDHAYVRQEEDLPFVKGKILLHEDIRRNIATKARVAVAYDEFLPDTPCNRILKRACRMLLGQAMSVGTQQHLREALAYFDQVTDMVVRPVDFEQLHLDRRNRRFEPYLSFARMLLLEASPIAARGESKVFSLLYPMETLFEQFVANYLWRYAHEFGVPRGHVNIQAKKNTKYLLRTATGQGKYRLRPDVVLNGLDSRPTVIADTKWKRLGEVNVAPENDVPQSDLYQMYAYANRYDCADNVLLYPKVPGASNMTFIVAESLPEKRLRVAFVDVGRDLIRQRKQFTDDLACALFGEREFTHVS